MNGSLIPLDKDIRLAMPLDPRRVEYRLWQIDLMAKSDFDSDDAYHRAVKDAVYRLRRELQELARG